MGTHITKGKLLEFDALGVGMVLSVQSSREPVATSQDMSNGRPFLLKASYVVEVLVTDSIHVINVSVHWYHPDGAPQGWWSPRILSRSPAPNWHAVNWL